MEVASLLLVLLSIFHGSFAKFPGTQKMPKYTEFAKLYLETAMEESCSEDYGCKKKPMNTCMKDCKVIKYIKKVYKMLSTLKKDDEFSEKMASFDEDIAKCFQKDLMFMLEETDDLDEQTKGILKLDIEMGAKLPHMRYFGGMQMLENYPQMQSPSPISPDGINPLKLIESQMSSGGFNPLVMNPSVMYGGFDPQMLYQLQSQMPPGGFDPSMFTPSQVQHGGFDSSMFAPTQVQHGGFDPSMVTPSQVQHGGFDPSMVTPSQVPHGGIYPEMTQSGTIDRMTRPSPTPLDGSLTSFTGVVTPSSMAWDKAMSKRELKNYMQTRMMMQANCVKDILEEKDVLDALYCKVNQKGKGGMNMVKKDGSFNKRKFNKLKKKGILSGRQIEACANEIQMSDCDISDVLGCCFSKCYEKKCTGKNC